MNILNEIDWLLTDGKQREAIDRFPIELTLWRCFDWCSGRSISANTIRKIVNHPAVTSRVLGRAVAHELCDSEMLMEIRQHPLAIGEKFISQLAKRGEENCLLEAVKGANYNTLVDLCENPSVTEAVLREIPLNIDRSLDVGHGWMRDLVAKWLKGRAMTADLAVEVALGQPTKFSVEVVLNASEEILIKIVSSVQATKQILAWAARNERTDKRIQKMIIEHSNADDDVLSAIVDIQGKWTDLRTLENVLSSSSCGRKSLNSVAKSWHTGEVNLWRVLNHPCVDDWAIYNVANNRNATKEMVALGMRHPCLTEKTLNRLGGVVSKMGMELEMLQHPMLSDRGLSDLVRGTKNKILVRKAVSHTKAGRETAKAIARLLASPLQVRDIGVNIHEVSVWTDLVDEIIKNTQEETLW